MSARLVCLSLFSLFCFAHVSFSETPEFVPGQLLVKFKPSSLTSTSGPTLGIPKLDEINSRSGLRRIQPLFSPKAVPQFQKKSSLTSQNDDQTLRSIVKIELSPETDLEQVIQAYQSDPNVAYAQPNYIHQVDYVPDDPMFADQWALQKIKAGAAWDIQRASADIIVGVIDTGIDYLHEDLRDAIWINAGEDLNGNGRVDASDFNGVDDDGNGFVDDIRGWDFTDAPTFPDGGDFQNPDNDPFDEHGHGTSVAGIIAATGDNSLGVAGLAFGCRVMNLRAGTSLGFLEEDDVASATVYAVENGARIINMSFGDKVASPLLRDVVQYAYNRNCILVASAGNSATDAIHFPSGFSETISVGATNEEDALAGFSNYGSSVDLVAPGVNLLTTKLHDEYGNFGGTSASAPVVSGLAALILSKTPELSNESVKGLLISTTKDLGTAGWDRFYASGRVDALAALQSPYFSIVRITEPSVDQGFAHGPIVVKGTAAGAFMQEFVVEIGMGESPVEWTEIFRQKNRQVIDGVLTEFDIDSLIDTVYTVRLSVQNKNGTAVENKVRFFVDRTPPAITNVRQTPLLEADLHSVLIEFETDDLCDAAIHYRQSGSSGPFQELKLRYRTTTHRVHITQETFTGELEYFIRVTNGAGLVTSDTNSGNNYVADLSGMPVGGGAFEKLDRTLPSGFLLSKVADFDQDGRKEVILNQYGENFNFGPLKILEANQNGFDEVLSTSGIFIPRDWGDSDGDGKMEILLGAGPNSFIAEALTPGAFPNQIVWVDTNNVWASRFADLDQDGRGEIIVRVKDVFTVWETTGDNQYALVDSLTNPTGGSNAVGAPHTEIADFDGDGKMEILIGDFDGDVYIYENSSDDQYTFTWSDSLPLVDTIDFLSHGDYDGDGVEEFVVGCHSDASFNSESTFDSRHWLYRVYKSAGDNDFAVVWQQAFFGFQSPADFDSGVASGDVDNDGRPEILINVFPDFYIVDYESGFAQYRVAWHAAPNRSNSAIVADFDNNGTNEFYFNTGEQVTGYQYLSSFSGPPTPLALKVRPLDLNLVELTWQSPGPVNGYRVYRGTDPQNLQPLGQVSATTFLDSAVTPQAEFWYAVTAIDTSLTPGESLPTATVRVRPGSKPFLEQALFLPPNQIQMIFSEPMDQSVKDQTHYTIRDVGTPTSAVLHKSGKEVILTVPADLDSGTYTVVVNDVSDLEGTPIDRTRNSASFEVKTGDKAPYLVSALLTQPNQLQLEFSQAMDPATASNAQNYIIEPRVKVAEALLRNDNPKMVILTIAPNSPIGPFGVDYFISVRNVKSRSGAVIKRGEGDTASLIFSSPDLSNVFAYPNPYRGNSAQDFVTIAGLTSHATVKILDASGRYLRTLEEEDGNGGVRWDLRDDSGKKVPSGVYIFYVVGESDKGVGKVAIVR